MLTYADVCIQEDEAEDTVLSAKLDEMTAMIINVGKVAAGVTIGVIFARFADAYLCMLATADVL
jgi:hypothetical protein